MFNRLKQMRKKWVALAGAALAVFAIPALAQTGSLAMLDTLAKGEWTITFRDGSPSKKVCVRSGRELFQIRHEGITCNQIVVQNEATKSAVQYKCRGNDYARTDLRRETSTLIQITSQGSEGGRDFFLNAEARRTGVCR